MNKRVLLTGLLIVHLYSCQKEAAESSTPETAATKMDVAYGTDPKQKMDIYLPAGRSADTTKSIILIHGGAWSEGDKLDFTPYVAQLQQKIPGYAVFNVNYRLAINNTNLFPSQENDIKAALEFINGKKGEYKISDKFVLLGASAGAHLALLQGYKYNTPIKPKAIVSFFGPTDLVALYNSSFIAALGLSGVTGTDPVSNPTFYQQSSPLTFVTAQSPPTILLQGGADPLVPVAQAEALKAKLTTSGVTNQYVFYPTQTHGWFGDTLNHSFDKITEFLKVNVP